MITLNLHGSVQENLTSLDNCRARRIRYEWLILILILVTTEHSGYLFHLRYIPSIATGDSQRLSISWSIEIHGIAKLSLCNRHLEDPWSRTCPPSLLRDTYTNTYRLAIPLIPRIIEPQNAELFNTHLPLTNLLRCIATIGSCNIIANMP